MIAIPVFRVRQAPEPLPGVRGKQASALTPSSGRSPHQVWGRLQVWGWADGETSVGLGPLHVLRSRIKNGPETSGVPVFSRGARCAGYHTCSPWIPREPGCTGVISFPRQRH